MQKKARLTITIDPRVDEQITAISKRTLVPKSALINKVLSEYADINCPIVASDIDYTISDNGSASITYQDSTYDFTITEGDDSGNEDYGERYLEITDSTHNQPVHTIQNAYNLNSLDDASVDSESNAIKEEIANRIVEYLHSKD